MKQLPVIVIDIHCREDVVLCGILRHLLCIWHLVQSVVIFYVCQMDDGFRRTSFEMCISVLWRFCTVIQPLFKCCHFWRHEYLILKLLDNLPTN